MITTLVAKSAIQRQLVYLTAISKKMKIYLKSSKVRSDGCLGNIFVISCRIRPVRLLTRLNQGSAGRWRAGAGPGTARGWRGAARRRRALKLRSCHDISALVTRSITNYQVNGGPVRGTTALFITHQLVCKIFVVIFRNSEIIIENYILQALRYINRNNYTNVINRQFGWMFVTAYLQDNSDVQHNVTYKNTKTTIKVFF